MPVAIKDKSGKRYIKGRGKFFYLSKSKKGALNDIPEGWQIIRINNRLYLKRKG